MALPIKAIKTRHVFHNVLAVLAGSVPDAFRREPQGIVNRRDAVSLVRVSGRDEEANIICKRKTVGSHGTGTAVVHAVGSHAPDLHGSNLTWNEFEIILAGTE